MIPPVYINHTAAIHPEGRTEGQPYLSACEPDYKILITNATLRRRMSRIVRMGVACGLECIGNLPPEQVQAIITATGLGCLADTEKFMNAIVENEEQLLNPTPFIQSTFNTIGAQIALICQIRAYNMTYVHRGLSFESALIDGMMRISEGDENVLVGAIDEITPSSHLIQQRLGLVKGTIAGEGAHFFLLSGQKNESTCAEILGVDTFIRPHTKEEISERICRFLERHNLTPENVDLLVTGKNGNEQQDAVYAAIGNQLFPHARQETFKDECGEFHTASAYAVWKAARTLREGAFTTNTVLIYNHYQLVNHSLILLKQENQ